MDSAHCLDASRTALVVIDVQGSFRRIAHDADAVLTRLESVIGTAHAAGVLVVHTQQRYGERVPEIVRTIAPTDADVVITKDSPDAFDGTDLADVLATTGVTRIAVGGFATEACIDSTVRAALSRGVDVVVLSDCHTTTIDRGTDPVAAADVVAHHNATFERLDHPGRSILVAPAERVRFSA